MANFRPERLSVQFKNGVQKREFTLPRKYTLTHSDLTGELFLTIGTEFALDNINVELRDEVLGEWIPYGNYLFFNVYLYIDSLDHNLNTAIKREQIFRRELPLALTAIRYGDRFLFHQYPALDSSHIVVNFISSYPELAKQENWGTFRNFHMTK